MVSLGGMLAAALSILGVSAQARAAGLFGTRMRRFSVAVAVVLVAAVFFVPILALLLWVVVTTVVLAREPGQALAVRPASSPSSA